MSWRRISSIRIALLLGVALSALRFSGCRYLELLDLRALDYRLQQRGVQAGSPDVVIVAVDDPSLEQFGRWPWSQSLVAQLVDRLTQAGAAVIGFDIVQSEATAEPDVGALRQRVPDLDERTWDAVRQGLQQGTAEDSALTAAVHASARTVLGYFFNIGSDSGDSSTVRLSTYNVVQGSTAAQSRRHDHVPTASGVRANLPALTAAAAGLGYFNFFPDPDGSYRRVPLAIRFNDQIALPLSLAMLHVYRPQVPLMIRFADFGVETVRFGALTLPVAEDGQLLVNFRGPGKTFRHVSAADVLAGRVAADAIRDKLVLVGVTATAVMDVRVTPFDGLLPGVEIHANVLDNILRHEFIQRPRWTVLIEVAVILLLTLILGSALHFARGILGALIALTLGVGYLFVSQLIFVHYGLPLSLIFPFLAIGLTYPAIAVQHYVVEEREKRKIRDAFGLYLSPSLARLVSERPEMLALGGEKRDLTVMFSDIRGFTTTSERLEPETLVELLNKFLGEMTDVIFAHDGTLDKYIGDAIMAVWGAPVPQADHAARACRAALGMVNRLRFLDEHWTDRGWPVLEIGIGINTGPMVVGNMGSERRLSYTVIGDNVNLGSRLEGLNKVYGSRIIASEATIRAAGDVVVTRELDLVRVKGKRLPVRIFEILALVEERSAWTLLLERFAAGLHAYRDQRWDEAMAAFSAVLEVRPDDGPSRLYLERCRERSARAPEPNWDGVTVMESK